MKTFSLSELQKELRTLSQKELTDVCIRLAKHKKENKELLSYLLFEAQNEKAYIENVKNELDELFQEINRKSAYTTKKGLQKIVRNMNRYIKFSEHKETEIELRVHFCKKVRSQRIPIDASAVINNLYYREIEKIKNAFAKLHEDLQLDYRSDLEQLGISV
jgi:hypothetical protein